MRHIVILFVLLSSMQGVSQNRVAGLVRDSISSQPLIGCNIAIYNAADSLLGGTITDIDGKFATEIYSTSRYLECSYVGYHSKRINLSDITPGKKLIIKMTSSGLVGCGPVILATPRYSVAVSELTSQDLAATQPTAINEALSSLPSVMMQQGTYTTNRLSIRGIGARNRFGSNGIRAYLDEIPLHSIDGSSAVEDLGTQWMDQIAVIAGHTGPGRSNGYGGAIIYEKQDPARYKYSLLETSQTIGAAGLHLQGYRLRGSTTQLKNSATKYDISYESLSLDGWRDHNETRRGNLLAHLQQRFADRSTLDLYLIDTDLRGEIPSSLSREDFENNPESAAAFWQNADGNEDYRRTIAGATYTRSSAVGTIKLTPYMTRFVSDELRPFNRELQDNTTWGLRASIDKRLWSEGVRYIDLTAGYDLQRDHIDIRQISNQGATTILPIDQQTNQAVYAAATYLTQDWTIKAGIDVTGLKTGDADYDPLYIAPSIEARYRLNGQWSAYTRAGRGYNQPTLDLLLVNPVEASQADEVTMGLSYNRSLQKSIVNAEVAVYHMWTDRELTTILLDEQSIVINGPASTITGLDLSGSWTTTLGVSSLTLAGSYTLLDTKVTNTNEADLSGKSWPAVPRHQGYASMTYSHGGFSVSARATHFDEMYIDTRNTLSSDAYTVIRSRLSYAHPTRLFNDRLTLQGMIEVDNLTNTSYASMVLPTNGTISPSGRYYYPGQPRNLLAQLKVGYYLW